MRRASFILAATLSLLCAATPVRASEATLFFYSPEFGPSNLSMLTEAVEAFLDDAAVDVRFQAFARLEDLQRKLAAERPGFLIAPDWLVGTECIDERVRPIAQPRLKGATSGRRALMAGPAIPTATIDTVGSVAAAVPAAAGNHQNVSITKFRTDHPGIRIIPVPKDIDALLAVGFGQVDAAFVSLSQFEMLERVNPKLTANLREIGYSQRSRPAHAGNSKLRRRDCTGPRQRTAAFRGGRLSFRRR
jgi:hypothetical protein